MFNLYINCEQQTNSFDDTFIQDLKQEKNQKNQKKIYEYLSKLIFLNLEMFVDNTRPSKVYNERGEKEDVDFRPRNTYCSKIELGLKKSFDTVKQFNNFGVERKKDSLKFSLSLDGCELLCADKSINLAEIKKNFKAEIGTQINPFTFMIGANRRLINLPTANFMSRNINDFFGPGHLMWEKSEYSIYTGFEVLKHCSFGVYWYYKADKDKTNLNAQKLLGVRKEGGDLVFGEQEIQSIETRDTGVDFIFNIFNIDISNITTCGLWVDYTIRGKRYPKNGQDKIVEADKIYKHALKLMFYTTFMALNYEYQPNFAKGAGNFDKFIKTLYAHLCINDSLKLLNSIGNFDKYLNFLILGVAFGILKNKLLYGLTIKIGCVYITIWNHESKWYFSIRFEPASIDVYQTVKDEVKQMLV